MKMSSRRKDEHGAVMVMAVGAVVFAMIIGALAIDLGRLAQTKRFDQKVADLAALDASRMLPDSAAVKLAAEESATRNGFPWTTSNFSMSGSDLNVCLGTMTGDTFTAGAGCTTGTVVRVQANSAFKTAFPFVRGPGGVNANAAAGTQDVAGFSLGSTLASLTVDDETTINRLFDALLGTSPDIDLDVLSYQGLANGFVSINELVAADATLGTPDQLLNSTVTLRRLAEAAVIALDTKGDDGDTAAATASTVLASFAASIDTALDLKLSDIMSIQQPGNNAALDGQINVFDLLTTGAQNAQLLNGVNVLSIPSLTVSVPGLVQSDLTLHLIEAPRLAFGPARADAASPTGWTTWAQTAQLGVELNTRITVGTGPICVLVCLPPLLAVTLEMPIVIDAAKATGSLTAVRCQSDPDDSEVDILVDTLATEARSALDLTVAVSGLNVPVDVVDAEVPLLGGTESLTFTGPFPTDIQSTAATGLGLSTALTAELSVLGGLINVGDVLALLEPVTTLIDDRILGPIFESLGLSIAGSDVRALAVGCGIPGLLR